MFDINMKVDHLAMAIGKMQQFLDRLLVASEKQLLISEKIIERLEVAETEIASLKQQNQGLRDSQARISRQTSMFRTAK